MLSVVGIFLTTGCPPGGLGTFGDHSAGSIDDVVDRMRACGLLTEGRVTFMEEATSWYDQCMMACYVEASCDDLTALVCGTGEPSAALYACLSSCMPEDFACQDGSDTIPGDWVCDGYDDCMDGSDEIDCPASQVFHCQDGSNTIPDEWVCDGYDDCMDGSDEIDCPASGVFHCQDGSDTIPDEWVCDMYDDCPDGSDEIGCAELICPGW